MAKADVRFRLRVRRGDDIAVGPGKIDLLEAIARAASEDIRGMRALLRK